VVFRPKSKFVRMNEWTDKAEEAQVTERKRERERRVNKVIATSEWALADRKLKNCEQFKHEQRKTVESF
jgi:hypothetical protein